MLAALSAQARLDLAQALAERQLRERHAKELIQAAEPSDLEFAAIPLHASAKCAERQMLGQLCEYKLSLVHRAPRPEWCSHPRRKARWRSNRGQKRRSTSNARSMD
jgi:hypothetical protein